MNPTLHLLSLLLLPLFAAAQEPGFGDEPAGPAATVARGTEATLLGSWVATGEDQERLEFRADGTLRVDGASLRYRVRGQRLTILAPGQALQGNVEVDAGTLTITLELADGSSRRERYRRVETAAGDPAPRERAGHATFVLPAGWRVARRDGDTVLLDPGFRPTDTLDALVLVTGGELAAGTRRRPVVDLLQQELRAVLADLAGQGIDVDAARAVVRPVRLPGGDGAEVELPGTAAGERPVTVWIGATRGPSHWSAVIAVMLRGKVAKFLPGARHVLFTTRFEAPDETADAATGSDGLDGLEFGDSSFGSDASLTTVYRFGAGGRMQRRTMFSSPLGGSDSQTPGTYVMRGDRVTMRCGDEVVEGRIERRGGDVVALHIGRAVYRRS